MKTFKRIVTFLIAIILLTAFFSLAPAEELAKIDLNKASAEEIMQIRGIGPKYAEQIVSYMEKNVPFMQVGDIKKVKGIGAKKFESIRDLFTVEMPGSPKE